MYPLHTLGPSFQAKQVKAICIASKSQRWALAEFTSMSSKPLEALWYLNRKSNEYKGHVHLGAFIILDSLSQCLVMRWCSSFPHILFIYE